MLHKFKRWKIIIFILGLIFICKVMFHDSNIFSEMTLATGTQYLKVKSLEGNMSEFFFADSEGERTSAYKQDVLGEDERISISERGDCLSIEAFYKEICFSGTYIEWLQEQGLQLYVEVGGGSGMSKILEPVALKSGVQEGYRIEKTMQDYGMTWSDIRDKQEYFIFGKVASDWSYYTGSYFRSGSIGDIAIVNYIDYGEAIPPLTEEIDIQESLGDINEWNKPWMLMEDADETQEIENSFYNINCQMGNSKNNTEIYEENDMTEFVRKYPVFEKKYESQERYSFYDSFWINIFLDYYPYGCKLYNDEMGKRKVEYLESSYEILYADEQYLCLRNYGTIMNEGEVECYENVTLLDLYKTGMGNGALSVGEGTTYDFQIDLSEIGRKIRVGEYWLEDIGEEKFDEDERIKETIRDFFINKQYVYRTYIKKGRIGFLIPYNAVETKYIKLEIPYKWNRTEDSLSLSEDWYKRLYESKEEWKESLFNQITEMQQQRNYNGKSWERVNSTLCYLYTDSLLCAKDQYAVGYPYYGMPQDYYYRYITYDMNSGKVMGLDDIVKLNEDFVRWLKASGDIEGNLVKGAYSQTDGRDMTLNMLKKCPADELKMTLTECEFYLEPGYLHIKLPYWNSSLWNKGWVSNGEDKIWKNWITIKTEDIEEFLKVEVW